VEEGEDTTKTKVKMLVNFLVAVRGKGLLEIPMGSGEHTRIRGGGMPHRECVGGNNMIGTE